MSKTKKTYKNSVITWVYIILLLILIGVIIWQFTLYIHNANNTILASISLPLIGTGYLVREIVSRLNGDSTINAPLPSKKKKRKTWVRVTDEELQEIIKLRRKK